MCDIAAAMAAINAIGTLVDVQQRNQQARQLIKHANIAAALDYNAIEEQQTQINKASQLEQVERAKQAMRERSRLKAAMSDANVTGLTPLRELAASYLQQEYDVGVMKANQEYKLGESERGKYLVEANRQSRILQARSQMTNPFLALLQIGSSALSGFGSGYQMQSSMRTWEG